MGQAARVCCGSAEAILSVGPHAGVLIQSEHMGSVLSLIPFVSTRHTGWFILPTSSLQIRRGVSPTAMGHHALASGRRHDSLRLQVDGVLVVRAQMLAFLLLEHAAVAACVQISQERGPFLRAANFLVTVGRAAHVALSRFSGC